jgi:hypothetical protein
MGRVMTGCLPDTGWVDAKVLRPLSMVLSLVFIVSSSNRQVPIYIVFFPYLWRRGAQSEIQSPNAAKF